jgi:Uma2 family endonuclease
MQTAEKHDFVAVEDYLASEEKSEIRHEYLGGLVYAMAGETTAHNRINGNLYSYILNSLRGGPCRTYISDIRVNFQIRDDEYFYYPDIVVTCDKRDTHERFVRFPKLIIEVSSPSTERIDRREKFFAYTGIGTLEEYVLIPQKPGDLTVFRKANNWREEKIPAEAAELRLESLQFSVPRSAIYEGI